MGRDPFSNPLIFFSHWVLGEPQLMPSPSRGRGVRTPFFPLMQVCFEWQHQDIRRETD